MNIKHLLYFLPLLVLTGCSDGFKEGYEDSYTPLSGYLYIENPTVTLAGAASEAQFRVRAGNTPWLFQGMASWITVNPSSGSEDTQVTVSAAENPSGESIRTSVFSLRATVSDLEYPISVTQNPSTPFMTLETTALSFTAAGGEQTVKIHANVAWKMYVVPSWVTPLVAADSSYITFRVAENTSGQSRSVTSYFYSINGDHRLASVTYTQDVAATPATSQPSLEFGNEGGSFSVSLTSEVAWTAETSDTWLELSPDEGLAGTTPLVISALPNTTINDRNGTINIKVGGQVVSTIEVRQRGLYLEVSPTSFEFASIPESHTLSVHSNVSWTVQYKPDWLTLSATAGDGDAVLTLNATEHTGTSNRVGTLKLGVTGTELSANVTLLQQGKYFSITPGVLSELGSKGGTHEVHIASNDAWTVTHTADWLNLSKTSGRGDIDVTLTASDNPSLQPRSATTTFSPTYATTVDIVTRQAGRYLTVDVTSLRFFAKGGTSDVVHVNTDATFALSTSDTWFSVQRNGSMFTVTASANTTGERREGKISITMTDLQQGEEYTLDLPVVQISDVSGIVVQPFGADQQWSIDTGSSATISVTGFGADQSWDKEAIKVQTKNNKVVL